jgi:hypothetical protein
VTETSCPQGSLHVSLIQLNLLISLLHPVMGLFSGGPDYSTSTLGTSNVNSLLKIKLYPTM